MLYMDASALVKLGLDEPGTRELRERINGRHLVSCEIAHVEVARALARRQPPADAAHVLGSVYLYTLDPMIRRDAAAATPSTLRTLDALHLATALRLAPELEAFICYDERLSAAAQDAGLPVEAPGR